MVCLVQTKSPYFTKRRDEECVWTDWCMIVDIVVPPDELVAALLRCLDEHQSLLEELVDRIATRLEATGAKIIYDF